MKIIISSTALVLALLISAGCKKDNHPGPGNTMPDIQQVADGMVSPVAIAEPADGSKRLFVVDQVGKTNRHYRQGMEAGSG